MGLWTLDPLINLKSDTRGLHMNINRGLTPLAVVLMLSGSLALTGCDDKQAQQGAQQMPEVGVVTLKTEPPARHLSGRLPLC
jgi:membrane fusion protein (multidrug efflux system)